MTEHGQSWFYMVDSLSSAALQRPQATTVGVFRVDKHQCTRSKGFVRSLLDRISEVIYVSPENKTKHIGAERNIYLMKRGLIGIGEP